MKDWLEKMKAMKEVIREEVRAFNCSCDAGIGELCLISCALLYQTVRLMPLSLAGTLSHSTMTPYHAVGGYGGG